ncbi:MAG TPA: Holliday junction resolvase RuvX [Chthonomonadaceae bacterium]|nr:Holliday junction resolvase RuvX [Chthonomonadaceae bacterium]
MSRIMALDVGEKTIGVAFSDETGTRAFPATTIVRQEGKKRDMAALRQLVAENEVKEIVVGLPLMLDGTRGIQAEKVEEFIKVLRNNVRIPITTQDERLSTSEAERVLIAADRRREERKRTVDSMAACLILQTYLDRRRNLKEQSEDEETA